MTQDNGVVATEPKFEGGSADDMLQDNNDNNDDMNTEMLMNADQQEAKSAPLPSRQQSSLGIFSSLKREPDDETIPLICEGDDQNESEKER